MTRALAAIVTVTGYVLLTVACVATVAIFVFTWVDALSSVL